MKERFIALAENRSYHRTFLHYAEAVQRNPRYTATSFPEENDRSPPLRLSAHGYIGVWGNQMHIWDICWYMCKAGVAVYFASDLPPKDMQSICHHAKVLESTERTRVECLKHANLAPYASFHSCFTTESSVA